MADANERAITHDGIKVFFQLFIENSLRYPRLSGLGPVTPTEQPGHSHGVTNRRLNSLLIWMSQNQKAPSHPTSADAEASGLSRRLGPFDATMIVMGGIIGSGIFMNPHVVAGVVHTPLLILGAWAVGGLIALAGAFIYAELAALRPQVGGQYAYIREALHPGLAFIYGWTLLLVVQSGGMAAVAVTFARYFIELSHIGVSDRALAAAALAILTVINCLGVRAGSALQSVLMVLKIAAIVAVAFGLVRINRYPASFDQGLLVGIVWLLLDIVTEVAMAMHTGHPWFLLIGSPAAPVLRAIVFLAWIAAPALFARRSAT